MDFNEIFEEVKKSNEFSEFKEQNPSAYLCAAFFLLDFETKVNSKQLDFYIPGTNKVMTFALNEKLGVKEDTIEKTPEEINPKVKIELEEAAEKAKKLAKAKVNKIIAILQFDGKRQIWNLTCMMDGFSFFKFRIDCMSGKVLLKEKGSLLGFIRKG